MTHPSAAAGTSAVVATERLCVEYDGVHVLEDVDLRVTAGEFVALLGANGSGKTTLVRALLGLEPVTHGRVLLFGTPLDRFRDWPLVSYVPQRLPGAANVPVSVWEAVLAGLISPRTRFRALSKSQREAAREALVAVDLWPRRHDRLDTLSGGQQRRVLIARALATQARLFVLDEPTAGVDAESQQRLADTLTLLAGQGHTVLLVAHELGQLAPLVTRTVVLGRGARGSVVYDGPTPPPSGLEAVVHHHPDEDPAAPGLLEG